MLRLGSQVVRRPPPPDLHLGLQGEKLGVVSAEDQPKWTPRKTFLAVVAVCVALWVGIAYLLSVLPDIFVAMLGYLLRVVT